MSFYNDGNFGARVKLEQYLKYLVAPSIKSIAHDHDAACINAKAAQQ